MCPLSSWGSRSSAPRNQPLEIFCSTDSRLPSLRASLLGESDRGPWALRDRHRRHMSPNGYYDLWSTCFTFGSRRLPRSKWQVVAQGDTRPDGRKPGHGDLRRILEAAACSTASRRNLGHSGSNCRQSLRALKKAVSLKEVKHHERLSGENSADSQRPRCTTRTPTVRPLATVLDASGDTGDGREREKGSNRL